jgi:Spy/CpxP family protein refolding chaperone
MNRNGFYGIFWGILAFVVVFAMNGAVSAHEPGHDGPRDHRWEWPRPTHHGLVTFSIENREVLGLSDEQVSKLKTVRNTFRKTSARIRAERMEAEEQFEDQMQMDSISVGEIEAISRRIETLEHELRMAYATAIADGKKTLTPGQLKKLRELRKGPRSKMM